jgi:hypothetical protein
MLWGVYDKSTRTVISDRWSELAHNQSNKIYYAIYLYHFAFIFFLYTFLNLVAQKTQTPYLTLFRVIKVLITEVYKVHSST